jgi:hypothetical protein
MFEYQGGVYPGVWVYDGSGAQIVGVRLYLTPTVLSDPIPLSQVRIVGSTVGGIINSSTPPLNPPPGTVWFNAGPGSVNGIPAGNYAYWNGTQWVLMGTTAPNPTAIASNTAPTNPALGTIWQNTSGQTVAGIPSGGYAYWNGSTWVSLGSSAPQLGTTGGSGAGVNTLNNLQGNVTLAEGSGIDITQAGNVITFTATGLANGAPGVSSLNGQTGAIQLAGAGGLTVGTSAGTVTLTAPPPGQSGVATFNGRSGAVTPVAGDYPPSLIGAATPAYVDGAIAAHLGAADPHAQYLSPPEVFGSDFIAANAAPTGPQAGQIWRNTSTNTVAGIPAGNWAVYNGTAWTNAGTRYPFAINSGNTAVSSLAPGPNNTWLNTNGSGQVAWNPLTLPTVERNPGFLARLNTAYYTPDYTVFQFIPGVETVDNGNFYNPATGIFTVPAGFGGVWVIGVLLQFLSPGVDPGLSIGATVNSVNFSTPDVVANGNYIASGFRPYVLAAGDVVRWYTFGGASGVNAGSIVYGFLMFPS